MHTHFKRMSFFVLFCAVWMKELIMIYSECAWISKVKLVRQRQRENGTAKADKEPFSCSGWPHGLIGLDFGEI